MPAAAVYPGYFALITHEDTGVISLVDLSTDPPRETLAYECGPETRPSIPVISQDRSRVLVGLAGSGEVLVLNLTGESLKRVYEIPVEGRPAGVAISPNGTLALVGNSQTQSVAILNLSEPFSKPYYLQTGQVSPMAVGITPDGRYGLIAAGSTDGTLSVVSLDGPEPAVQYTIPVGASPRALAVDPTGRHVIVPLAGERKPFCVTVINTSTEPFFVEAKVPVGNFSPGIPTISPDGRFGFVPLGGSYEVAVVDLFNKTPFLAGTLVTGRDPGSIAFLPDSSVAFVTTSGASSLIEISLPGLQVKDQDILPYYAPYGIALFTGAGSHVPFIKPLQPFEIEVGKLLSFSFEVTDVDGDLLTTMAMDMPPGAMLNGTSFSWVPLLNQTGRYSPVFTVNDGVYTSRHTVDITVVGNGPGGMDIPPPPAVPGM
jgi:DNA-binding beta-propeller fold protein YncE